MIQTNDEVALRPSVGLLIKLGEIVLHAQHVRRPSRKGGRIRNPVTDTPLALVKLLDDPEVTEWRAHMQAMALIPRKQQ